MLTLDSFQQKKTIKLKAKKLAYSCDVTIDALKKANEVTFLASGTVRFAILQSKIEIQSVYKSTLDQLRLESYKINVPQKNWLEHYERDPLDHSFEHITSSSRKKIDVGFDKVYEPLFLLFKYFLLDPGFEKSESLKIFTGSKVKEVQSFQTPSGAKINVSGSSKIEITKKNNQAEIHFLPLRIKLEVECIDF